MEEHRASLIKRARAEARATLVEEGCVHLSGGEQMPAALIELWRQGSFTDAQISVRGVRFSAHRIILAGGSRWARAALTNGTSEANGEIFIQDIEPEVFRAILDYLYLGCCSVKLEILGETLRAAQFLQVDQLERAAILAAEQQLQLNSANSLEVWSFAEALTLPDLAAKARKASLRHFEAAVRDNVFLSLSQDQLTDLISQDDLCATEEAVYDAVERWVKAQKPSPSALCALLSKVRFALLPRDVVKDRILRNPLMRSVQPIVRKQLREAQLGVSPSPRIGAEPNRMYVFGGTMAMPPSPHGHPAPPLMQPSGSLIFKLSAWSLCRAETLTLPLGRWMWAEAVALDKEIYLIGGEASQLPAAAAHADSQGDGSVAAEPSVRVWRFSPEANVGCDVAPLPRARTRHAAVACAGRIFVFGGMGESGLGVASMDIFDPLRGIWEPGPRMHSVRYGHCGVAVGGLVFAIGGRRSAGYCVDEADMVEAFNVETGVWQSVPPMHSSRVGAACTTFNGLLYVFGGRSYAGNRLSSVEVYDPMSGVWEEAPAMRCPRGGHNAVTIGDKIYVVGGDGPGCALSSIEYYDPELGQWHAGPDLEPNAEGRARVAYAVATAAVGRLSW